jgi:hypothetical protein
MSQSLNSDDFYPLGLLRWAGHRDGGVRKPFRSKSGRPTGSRIVTPLVTKLQDWTKDLLTGDQETPTSVILVGGPGNGKTDAIETCIEFLDDGLHANGVLMEAFAQKYEIAGDEVPPRKVIVDLEKLGIPLPNHMRRTITLVQDATEGDPESHKSAEQLLLEELEERIDPNKSGIYLCCVNRGILAHAATLLKDGGLSQDASDLLNKVTEAVTSGPTSPQCWPLTQYTHFAIWPMDVESLVDDSRGSEGKTVAHQIFKSALDPTRWNPVCAAGDSCPFCQNKQILSRDGAIDSIVKLLRYYELASGKRWTFRDLFSLVPYLLVGDYSELQVKGKQVSPCEWTSYQLQQLNCTQNGETTKHRSIYLLVSRLYHHRLFPRWPSLDKGEIRKAKDILKTSFEEGSSIALEFFRYLAQNAKQTSHGSSEIHDRIRHSLGDLLDPAVALGETVLYEKGDLKVTINDIEERFSVSVYDGLEYVSNNIQPLEIILLNQLAKADDALAEENFSRIQSNQAKLLQSAIRQFAVRIAKRSMSLQHAICCDMEYFIGYEKALSGNSREFREVITEMKNLLHDDKNRFRASLVTTFGQPIAHRLRDIVLLTSSIAVRELPLKSSIGRPPEPLPYIRVDQNVVPLTFALYKALREVVAGLHDASLPAEIFALLNGIKSLVSGYVVRNKEILDEGSHIEIGGSNQSIRIDGQDFHMTEKSRK